MTTIAADTWGIPGPAFAALYPFLLIAVAVVVFVGRRSSTSGTAAAGAPLTPAEVAYLRGGDVLAVATALGQLRAAGALDDHARPVATSMSKDRLDSALLTALHGRSRPADRHVTNLAARPAVRTALHAMRDRLRARGLIRSQAQVTAARTWSLLLWAVAALGVARVVAGVRHGKPTGFIAFETMVALIVAVIAMLPALLGQNAAARAAIADATKANRHLDPKLKPSWATYGATGAGMSIALFGAGALLVAEPAFADSVAARQASASAGGSSSSGDGGGGSSCGSSCGGGGCGG